MKRQKSENFNGFTTHLAKAYHQPRVSSYQDYVCLYRNTSWKKLMNERQQCPHFHYIICLAMWPKLHTIAKSQLSVQIKTNLATNAKPSWCKTTSLQHGKMVYAKDIVHIHMQMKEANIYMAYIYICMQGFYWAYIAHIHVYMAI